MVPPSLTCWMHWLELFFCCFVLYNQCMVILINQPCFLFPLDIKSTHCCYCTQKDRLCLASWARLKQGETVNLAAALWLFFWALDWRNSWRAGDFFVQHHYQVNLSRCPLLSAAEAMGCQQLSLAYRQHLKNSWQIEKWPNNRRGQRTMRTRWRSRWCTWMEGSSINFLILIVVLVICLYSIFYIIKNVIIIIIINLKHNKVFHI